MLKVILQTFCIILLVVLWFPDLYGQPVLPSDLKKPKKYENRKLGSEKSSEKKFKLPRKFIQNTVTHYNWYFNANERLKQVIERAKLAHKEDYSQLLPFYNYSIEQTSADKELDSVIIKSNAGILIHDLRNSWIDNLYMLMGKAYYFRNNLDSAYLTFQYINYAFSKKEKDGYDIPIGSNATEGGTALSVSTKEKNSVVNKALTTPPSRNESFIWQIKTYIARDMMPEAVALIETIKHDPVFPERLETDLNEVQALYFYQRENYDSAAFYLERALGNAESRQEAARWEYLIGQLYELSKKPTQAVEFYERARKRTLDPVLEVYAILNSIKQNRGDSAAIKKNIEELRKMGRRDKYTNYRDIIYYTAAQIELERNNIPGAKEMLIRSTKATSANLNPSQRSKSFLLLADLYYDGKEYHEAKNFYDSVNNNDPGVPDPVALENRKVVLSIIVSQLDVIQRQDSLQKIAAMPEAQRIALLKKMVRTLRRKQGLKEEEQQQDQPGNAAVGMNNNDKPPPDLFNSTNDKGDWYFSNPSLKSKGYTAFRQKWGNRPNVDNWRRQSAIVDQGAATGPRNPRALPGAVESSDSVASGAEISIEALSANLPLTPEKLELSNDSIENAMVDLGVIYVDKLEEYALAIDTLESFIHKFSYSNRKPEALYYLYYAYQKTGNTAKATAARAELDGKYPETKYQQLIYNAVTGADKKKKDSVTTEYEKIYNLFIEGNFTQALEEKRVTDSIYGTSYWTPQLLYIESVYYLHERKDEEAKKTLNNIVELYPNEPIAEKAKLIIDVLGRRKEIEDYLTQLKIERVEDSVVATNARPIQPERIGTPLEQDTTRLLPKKLSNIDSNTTGRRPEINVQNPTVKKDSVRANIPSAFSFNVEAAHDVVIVMNRVDPVYVTETRNAFNRYNQANYAGKTIEITNQALNDSIKLVVLSGFDNAAVALGYLQNVQPVAARQIVPWLPAGKYSFLIISKDNLEVLKNNPDMNGYNRFQERYFNKP
jgi:tetratricopeptide (TPR) repeat protein